MKQIKKINTTTILLLLLLGVFITINYYAIYEGLVYVDGKDNYNIQKVVIEPQDGKNAYYLHLAEIVLYGDNGKIEYDASSSRGNFGKGYELDKLSDSNRDTFFHSGQLNDARDKGRADKFNCTLTIIPKNASIKITKIMIVNRLDCCHERLKDYKISIIKNDGTVFYRKNFIDMSNLYVSPFMEEILIS